MRLRISILVSVFTLATVLYYSLPNSFGQTPKGKLAMKSQAFSKGAAGQPAKAAFKVNVNLVVVRVMVMDANQRYATGLEQENFRVFEDKVEQKISHFAQDAAPISVGIILDISGSMKNCFASAKTALLRFLEERNTDDEYFLITFNQKVTLDVDFTMKAADIRNRAAIRLPGGRTALYDAVYMGLEKLQEAHNPKKALIVITDGEDNSSRYSFNEVRELAKETDALIYAIAKEGTLHYGRPIINSLAHLTGGRCFFPSNFDQLDNHIHQIHNDLRNYYVIGYHSTNRAADGTWRKIKVKMEQPEGATKLSVWARQGYYAAKK